MKVVIKYGNSYKEFKNQATITIGNNINCDFIIPELTENEIIKMVFAEKYNNYVLMNTSQSREILCNNKVFSKVLVTPKFVITSSKTETAIEVSVAAAVNATQVQNKGD